MYNWLRSNYIDQISANLEEKVEYGELTPLEAEFIFQDMMEDWDAGYGDAMYDIRGDY